MSLCLRNHDLDWREIDDEIVALDVLGSVYLSVRGPSALVWRLLAGSTSRDTLIETLTEAYGIDAGVAAADVDRFIADLDARGLLSS
jgi:hypothetical protein